MYSSNLIAETSSKIPTERQVLTWLRKRIHPGCWGRSDHRKEGFRRTTRRQVLNCFRGLRFGLPGCHLPRMTNSLMMEHMAGKLILYFQADGRYEVAETLICIDIDCHERGSYEGACACVAWLVDHGFPGLFWSRSTNGRGVHAYVRVDKVQTNDRGLDRALLEFERWLKFQLAVQKWDIEDIEVKGRPPLYTWGDEKYELLGVKMGSLAKLPVEAVDRPAELMVTTLKRVDELRLLGEEVPSDRVPEGEEDNCTTYTLPLRDDPFGEIDADDLNPFIPDPRNREWPFWVERMAKIGLVDEDSMAEVVFELAKWLLWIELFGEEEREARSIELLQRYVLDKHNGLVTRLNEGKEDEVLSHVGRIVEGAGSMAAESKELFLRVRQKRQQRKYKRLIEIIPILEGSDGEGFVPGMSDVPGGEEYNCTTYSLPLSPESLPPALEDRLIQHAETHRMRRSRGEFPLVRFARRFLGLLWHNTGSARIHTDDLATMVGNVNQQIEYKQVLLGLGLIRDWTGTYRVHAASSPYRLTDEAKRAYEAAYRSHSEAQAV